MTRAQRRRLSPEARKLEIIEATERLMQAGGARLRVEDVAREAGVAKGTVFLYFPTFDDLLDAVRARVVAAFDAANPLPTEADGPVDWPGLVDAQAAAFVDFTLSRRGIGEAVFHSEFAERRPMTLTATLRLSAVIRAGQEAGAFGAVDPEPTARLLFAAIDAAGEAVAGGADRDTMVAALQALLRRALAPQGQQGGAR